MQKSHDSCTYRSRDRTTIKKERSSSRLRPAAKQPRAAPPAARFSRRDHALSATERRGGRPPNWRKKLLRPPNRSDRRTNLAELLAIPSPHCFKNGTRSQRSPSLYSRRASVCSRRRRSAHGLVQKLGGAREQRQHRAAGLIALSLR